MEWGDLGVSRSLFLLRSRKDEGRSPGEETNERIPVSNPRETGLREALDASRERVEIGRRRAVGREGKDVDRPKPSEACLSIEVALGVAAAEEHGWCRESEESDHLAAG